MRMFVAVVPPADVLDDVEKFLEPRRDADDGLRWTDRYQWHVTLSFMADVAERRVEDLTERLCRSAARRSPPRLRLGGAGAFPSVYRARVLWLGVAADPPDGLSRLAEASRAAAVRAGVRVEGGRFRAHLTLARLRQPADATRWLRVLDGLGPHTWVAEDVQLIESHLGEGRENRPRYESVATFPLGHGAEAPRGEARAPTAQGRRRTDDERFG